MHLGLKRQLKKYKQEHFQQDLFAGTVVATLLLPQAVAYAELAGLPASSGLLATMLPMIIYALLGSSRSLSVGPVAIAALMTQEALDSLAPHLSRNLGAACLSLQLAGFLLLFAWLKAGRITHFISHSVISGFSSGAAVLIIISQTESLLGIKWTEFWRQPSFEPINYSALILGILGIGILAFFGSAWLKRFSNNWFSNPKKQQFLLKAGVPLSIFSLSLIALTPLSNGNIAFVGSVTFELDIKQLYWQQIPEIMFQLMPSAAIMALIVYMESVAVGRILANYRKERLDPNQELWALGFANLGSSLSLAMPTAGGFGRSMVNAQCGACTQISAIVSAVLMIIFCFFATSLFAYVPKAALSVIVIYAVLPLIDLTYAKRLWILRSPDFGVWICTLIGVIIINVDLGLALGIAASIGTFIFQSGSPHLGIVGRLPGTEQFRNIRQFNVETLDKTLFIRIDESLFFANVQIIEDEINLAISQFPKTEYLVIIGTGINKMDSDGIDFLERLQNSLDVAGITLLLAEFKHYLLEKHLTHHWMVSMTLKQYYPSAQMAFEHLKSKGQKILLLHHHS